MSSASSEELQRIMYIYQMLEKQQQAIREQIELIEQQQIGANISKASLEGLRNAQQDQEIIISLGKNAFTKARLVDPNKIIIGVHKEILIEKTLDDSLISIDRLITNFKDIQQRLYTQFEDVSSKLNQIRPQVEQIYQMTGRRS